MAKPLLCLDFDGVIHSYTSGWQGADRASDRPVPGAIEFLAEATQVFRVAIYSSRSHQPGGIECMKVYVEQAAARSGLPDISWLAALEWPTSKPSAMVTLDDRALTFKGTWPPLAALLAFKPWNKRSS